MTFIFVEEKSTLEPNICDGGNHLTRRETFNIQSSMMNENLTTNPEITSLTKKWNGHKYYTYFLWKDGVCCEIQLFIRKTLRLNIINIFAKSKNNVILCFPLLTCLVKKCCIVTWNKMCIFLKIFCEFINIWL